MLRFRSILTLYNNLLTLKEKLTYTATHILPQHISCITLPTSETHLEAES